MDWITDWLKNNAPDDRMWHKNMGGFRRGWRIAKLSFKLRSDLWPPLIFRDSSRHYCFISVLLKFYFWSSPGVVDEWNTAEGSMLKDMSVYYMFLFLSAYLMSGYKQQWTDPLTSIICVYFRLLINAIELLGPKTMKKTSKSKCRHTTVCLSRLQQTHNSIICVLTKIIEHL